MIQSRRADHIRQRCKRNQTDPVIRTRLNEFRDLLLGGAETILDFARRHRNFEFTLRPDSRRHVNGAHTAGKVQRHHDVDTVRPAADLLHAFARTGERHNQHHAADGIEQERYQLPQVDP